MLGVSQDTVSLDMKNCHLAKIHNDLGANWSDQHIADWCRRSGIASFVEACPQRQNGSFGGSVNL